METFVSPDFSNGLMSLLEEVNGVLPMIHASFDDFGNCKEDGFVGMAGYVAMKSDWDSFNGRWPRGLKDAGLKYLHTSEYLQSIPMIGGTGGHTDESITALLKPFTTIIKSTLVYPGGGIGIIVAVRCDASDALTAEEEKVIYKKPELHCFEVAIRAFQSHTATVLKENGPLAVQMDESNNSSQFLDAYRRLKASDAALREYLGAICFADDKLHPPIQAADMLSHLSLKAIRRDVGKLLLPKAFLDLASQEVGVRNCDIHIYDKERLKALAARRMASNSRSEI